MAIRSFMLLAAAATAFSFAPGGAQAQTPHRTGTIKPHAAALAARPHHPVVIAEMSDAMAKPLVIQKRSFLDPGNVVPIGQGIPANVVFNTTEHRQVYSSYNTAFFGNSELPDRFDLPPTNPRWNPSAEPRIPLPFE